MESKEFILNGYIIFRQPETIYPCVYMVKFDDGKFYIGSTTNLNKRCVVFKSNIRTAKSRSKLLATQYSICKSVELIILEEVKNGINLREKETEYIKSMANDNCLNRAKTGLSNKGIKWTTEEKIRTSIGSKGTCKNRHKIICKCDINGNVLDIFTSLNKAAINIGIKYSKQLSIVIQSKTRKKRPYKGFFWKYAE